MQNDFKNFAKKYFQQYDGNTDIRFGLDLKGRTCPHHRTPVETCVNLSVYCIVGAETERCSRHDGFYPKQTDLYRHISIIRSPFVSRVLKIGL